MGRTVEASDRLRQVRLWSLGAVAIGLAPVSQLPSYKP